MESTTYSTTGDPIAYCMICGSTYYLANGHNCSLNPFPYLNPFPHLMGYAHTYGFQIWMPIETAPKDKAIVGWFPDRKLARPIRWVDPSAPEYDGWWVCEATGHRINDNPSHWIPAIEGPKL